MSRNYNHKIDSLLDNDRDISTGSAGQNSIVNHGGSGYARTLLLILPDGNEKFFHYSYLIDATFIRESGDIVMSFTSVTLTLRGQRLHSLFRDLSKHEPYTIIVTESRYEGLADKNLPIVTSAEIVDKSNGS